MRQTARWLTLCGTILALLVTACAPQAAATATPTLLPKPIALPTVANPFVTRAATIREIDAWLTQLSEDGSFTGSVLVGHQGTVLLCQGYGLSNRAQRIPNTPQTRFRIASITKQFTAMAILILQAQGKIQVENRICNYVSNCPMAWQAITLHHLLTHTSGILNYTLLSDYDGTRTRYSSQEQIMDLFKDLPLYFQPGEKWSYSNSGYIVLGYIIERVSGKSYEAFLQQSILTPLNMRDTGYTHNSDGLAAGYVDRSSQSSLEWNSDGADGALYSTVQDLYLWDQSLYTEQLLPQAQLDEMFALHTDPVLGGLAYGYGWFVGKYQGQLIAEHEGGEPGARTIIARYPDDQVSIIVLSNQRSSDVEQIMLDLSNKIFDDK